MGGCAAGIADGDHDVGASDAVGGAAVREELLLVEEERSRGASPDVSSFSFSFSFSLERV